MLVFALVFRCNRSCHPHPTPFPRPFRSTPALLQPHTVASTFVLDRKWLHSPLEAFVLK